MVHSAELDLKAAISLVNEASEEIESLKRASEMAETAWDAGVWKGLKASFEVTRERVAILEKLEQAISLASSAKLSDPGVSVVIEEEGKEVELIPDSVIQMAYTQKGIMWVLLRQWQEAKHWFQEALKVFPTSDTQFRLACTVAAQGYRNEAMAEFQRVIELDPTSEEAVEARKALLELRQMKPKKWSTALLLSIFLGFYGADRFYLGYILHGILKFFTFGGFGVW